MDLSIGTHLVTPRIGFGKLRLYDHHGIFVECEKVIHFSGMANSLSKGPIEETSIDEFRDGHPCFVLRHRKPKFSRDEAAKRAREALEKPSRYNLMFNNCEHFVNWCIEGKLISSQSDLASVLVAFVTGGGVTGSAALALYQWRRRRIALDGKSERLA
jgi:hypothetical protein